MSGIGRCVPFPLWAAGRQCNPGFQAEWLAGAPILAHGPEGRCSRPSPLAGRQYSAPWDISVFLKVQPGFGADVAFDF